jgi:hypothetical protein
MGEVQHILSRQKKSFIACQLITKIYIFRIMSLPTTQSNKEFLHNLFGTTYYCRRMYRGTHIKIDLSANRSAWLTDVESEANKLKYGKFVYVFKTAKPLKLINLSSWFFRFHFMDELNKHYDGKENTDAEILREKMLTLLPIGSPNFQSQCDNVSYYNVPKPYPPCGFDETNHLGLNRQLKKTAECFGGHRFSEKDLDKRLTNMLKIIYGDIFDGYIIPVSWPSCWHRFFPREICVFDQSSSLRFVSKTVIDNKTGGAKKTKIDKSYGNDDSMVDLKALFDKMCETDDGSDGPLPTISIRKKERTVKEKDEFMRRSGWVPIKDCT